MKIVSFKVAQAIKEAGYPQNLTITHYTNCGELVCYGIAGEMGFDVPTYLEVWLWLWQKQIYLKIEKTYCVVWFDSKEELKFFSVENSPEEAIIAAIEYLADNDLIK